MDPGEFDDLMDELREAKERLAQWKKALREIRNLCDAPHFDSARRWKIRDRCNAELGTPHGE